ncbi:MAG: hypothetical protein OXU79_14475 [Gemmatimonadota bacterium]|nr:hypothetical protein [Gemmatimonadota bacterium]
MGVAVIDVPVAGTVSSLIDRSARENMVALSRSSILSKIYRNFEDTNDAVLNAMSDWREFLKLLEQNPGNYKSMCRNGDVERSIAGLDEAGKTVRRKTWLALGEKIKENHPGIYEKFKAVDENIEAYGALLQEVSWTLLILHRENQSATGKSFSVDEAIADLWR